MTTIAEALTTVARLKTYLDITGTSKDTLLSMIIIGTSSFFERVSGRSFGRQAVSQEVYNGKGTHSLVLRRFPIDTAQTFTLERRDNYLNESDSWETVDSEQYFVNAKSGIIKGTTGFYAGNLNYRVTYTGGFYLPSDSEFQDGTDDDKDLPYDVELAVLKLCAYEYTKRKSVGVQSERVRDMQIVYMKAVEQDKDIQNILQHYKTYGYA
jgi:hypothetical protein